MAEGRSLRKELSSTVEEIDLVLRQLAEVLVGGASKEQKSDGQVVQLVQLFNDHQRRLQELLARGRTFSIGHQ